jgi:aminopeptidase N
VLQSEKFWGVKVEIIQNLVDLKLNQALEVLLQNLNDSDPRVKKAVIQALSSFKTKEVFDILLPIAKDFNQSYFVQNTALNVCGAIANSTLIQNIDKKELLSLYAQILKNGSTWGEVVRIGAISGLTHFDTQEALDLLVKYTHPNTTDSLRRAAVRSLGVISKNLTSAQQNQIIAVLDQVSKEENFYMEMAICQAAQSINNKLVIPILEHIKNHASDEHSTKLAEESIVKVIKNLGSDKSIVQINQELEKLKKTNQDLKSRLEFLEAKK